MYTSNLKDCQKESHDVSLTFLRDDMNNYQLTVIQPPSAEGVHLELPVTKGSKKYLHTSWKTKQIYKCLCVYLLYNLLAV